MSSAREFRAVHIACLPQYDLHDDVEFVALHFELAETILL